MKIGVYYYPEQWPRAQWERDFDNIAAMKLQIVHMGEFAWHTMEPKEGQIQLDWLSECVEMAAKRKLDVIMCTPTAVPPNWIVEKYPEILLQDPHGTPVRVGGRRHYSPTSTVYIDHCRRITNALVERFGKHPSIIGWQIDNEYSGPHDQHDYTHQAFREWLQKKYGTIDALNAAWGCQFWNTFYDNWQQVMFPPGRTLQYDNPHHRLDGARFWSWAWANFNRAQAEIIRQSFDGHAASGSSEPGRTAARTKPFITTNFMSFHLDSNPQDMGEELNLFSWDAYPVTGRGHAMKNETYRIADPNAIEFMHEQMASYNGRWGQMELQPGHVNWSGVPVLLHPGVVRLWLWTAFAHGAEFVTTYRFRQPLFGTELFHSGLVDTTGTTPSMAGREFTHTIEEMQRLDSAKISPSPGTPGEGRGEGSSKNEGSSNSRKALTPYLSRSTGRGDKNTLPEEDTVFGTEVGIVFDFEQLWYYDTLPQANCWNQTAWLLKWYGALARMGLRVKVLHANRPWPSDLPMIVVPGLQMVDEKMVGQMEQYVQASGNLVLTCRTAWMDKHGQLFEGPIAKPILKLIGGSIEAYDSMPEQTVGHVEMDGKKYPWAAWAELLYNEPTTKILAKYSDQFYAGATAVIQNKIGKGTVTYCGVCPDQAMIDALIEKLATQFKLSESVLPDRVHVVRRGRYNILLNYQDKPVTAPAAKEAVFVIGSRKVEPAGVAVWESQE